ncbi:MAG: histidine kinase [Bacteroidetes bacterium]|nr:histidine kinase [Bacteroidota bacterium]
MNIYPLIFSNNPRYRIARHILFWGSWILYYTIFVTLSWPKFPFFKAFVPAIIVETLSMPMDMAFCYSIIYFLIPRYLSRGKYISFVLLWLLLSLVFIFCFRLYTNYVDPAIYASFGMHSKMEHSSNFIWDFFYLFSQINMEGCLTAAIKLGKMWYIKQQEVDLIKSEKSKIEPVLHNGEMKPVFLINALDKVELLSQQKPIVIPGMIRKIKNLLLYILYDTNQGKVNLQKELKLIEEYVALEKEGNDNLKVQVNIIGNMSGERIAPFIILSLVENSFRQLSLLDLKDKFLNLEIRFVEGQLYISVAWSKPVDSSTLANGGNVFLQNIGKRLNLLYPHSHELKVLIKTDQFIINCKIDLHEAIN